MMRYLRYFVCIYLFMICISISSISNAVSLSEKLPLDISRNVFNVVFTNPNGMPNRDVFLSDITITKVQNDGWAYGSYQGPQGLKYGWFNLNSVVLTNGVTASSILSNEMVVKSYANVYANVYNNAPSITNALGEGVRVTAISNNISNRILCIYRLNNRNCLGWIPAADLIKSTAVKEPLPDVNYIGKYEGLSAEVSKNGSINGAATRPKKLEAFIIALNTNKAGGSTAIAFRGYYNGGWEQWKSNGSVWAGKPGMAYPIEAIAVQLTGEWATKYDIYYRVYINSYGWSGWARNGEAAGSKGDNRMIDAMQVELVYKGDQHEHASNSFLTLMSSKIDAKIVGNITSITSRNNNQISVVGICRYDTIPRYEAKVSIYVGGDKGDANTYRTETIAKFANNVDGWFGITCSGIQKVGNQDVNIYGYNKYTGKDVKIYSGKVYINGNFNHSPEGTITSFYSPADYQVYISGIVYDRDDMTRQVPVQVNIGSNASDSVSFNVAPNQTFSRTLSLPNVSGAQGFNIYAIDDYGPNRKDTVLKSGTIEVKPIKVVPPPTPIPDNNSWKWPTTSTRVTANWPKYSGGSYHSGIDFGVPLNSPVYSTCDGVVDTVKSLTNSYGKYIIIRSTVNGQTVYMYYCHMNRLDVSVGQTIKAGQQIGLSGQTGNATGPHLHYEVRNANKHYGNISSPTLNPKNYLPGTGYTFRSL